MTPSLETPWLDKTVLERLASDPYGGPQLISELLAIFLKATPERLATLLGALAKKDAVLLERTAHNLKSTSASVGASRLSEVSAAVEASAKASDWPRITALIGGLEEAVTRTVAEFEAYRAQK